MHADRYNSYIDNQEIRRCANKMDLTGTYYVKVSCSWKPWNDHTVTTVVLPVAGVEGERLENIHDNHKVVHSQTHTLLVGSVICQLYGQTAASILHASRASNSPCSAESNRCFRGNSWYQVFAVYIYIYVLFVDNIIIFVLYIWIYLYVHIYIYMCSRSTAVASPIFNNAPAP